MTNFVSILLGVLGILAAVVMQLYGKNRQLKDQVGALQSSSIMQSLLTKKEEQENVAKNAEDAYNTVKSQYLNAASDGTDTKPKT